MAGLAWRAPHQEGAFGVVPWRALVLIVGATLFFGLGLRGLGLLPVLLVVVFATAWASRYASLKASAALALGIALFCSGLFIKGLGLPLPLTGPWLSAALLVAGAPPPAPAARRRPRRPSKGARAMELLDNLGLGFATALVALEPALRLRRLPARHRRRRAARASGRWRPSPCSCR